MILLLVAIFSIKEYSFYILLRWIVCLTSIYIAYLSYEARKFSWICVIGIIALIFNPIIPFHLNKDIWIVIDFIVAIIFGMTIYVFRKADKEKMRK